MNTIFWMIILLGINFGSFIFLQISPQEMKNIKEKIMTNKYPSIFNDVIGPVMRGPSSSHCAASVRIGRIARDLMKNSINKVLIEYDINGSLATTHESQGSDMGLFGGLLGMHADDENLYDSPILLKESGIDYEIIIKNYGFTHPNTYKLTLQNNKYRKIITAISTGGGMIEITSIDSFKISMEGNCYETLFFFKNKFTNVPKHFEKLPPSSKIILCQNEKSTITQVKSDILLNKEIIKKMASDNDVFEVIKIHPVLPTMSYNNIKPPFLTAKEMTSYNKTAKLNLYELAELYECSLGTTNKTSVFNQMLDIVNTLKISIKDGIKGTTFKDRILGSQSVKFNKMMKNNSLPDVGMLNNIIHYVTVLMEVKSSMGVIIAAPTAGSCGALPGTLIAAAEYLGKDDTEIAKAMLVAGLIGIFICNRSTFAAEVCGCQAECGAGSGMTAAALIYLFDGNVQQSISAASMSIQNILGLVCDPIANRVEAPCLGRNIMAASNALSTANTILAGYNPLIPLDEVIEAMDETGKSISHELRCTALGGLSITPTSKKIENDLNRKKKICST